MGGDAPMNGPLFRNRRAMNSPSTVRMYQRRWPFVSQEESSPRDLKASALISLAPELGEISVCC